MPNKTIEMVTIRQLLRLYFSGKGTKSISQTTGVARGTVKKYLRRYVELRLPLEDLDKLSDIQLSKLFLVNDKILLPNKRLTELEPLLPNLSKMLKKRGTTKAMVYECYCKQCPDGYKSSAFIEKLNSYMNIGNCSMKMQHKAGDKLFVDYTGKKLQLVDQQTGEVKSVEVFVAILGCSQLIFVMAVATQKKEDFLMTCEKALHFYGGVPLAIVPDNLKSAVTKASRYEAVLNEHFAGFAEHYQTVGFPTRAYKPKDKALVEGAVKIVYTSIFTKIDEQVYHHLDDMNKAILVHLQVLNDRVLTGENYGRQQQFNELEKHTLKPLNPYPYEMMHTALVTVNKYGHVLLSVDKRYYSVPYQLIGKRLKIKYSSTKVELYDGIEAVALHTRSSGNAGRYTTQQEHLASNHKYLSEWNPQSFMDKAIAIDEVVANYIAKVLAKAKYPEQSYKSCNGILNLGKRLGNDRLINACKRADSYGRYDLYILQDILHRNIDSIAFEQQEPNTSVPAHENIRGQNYYQ